MARRCEKCVGKPFCSCPKDRPKDKPPERWRSPRRERILTHRWSTWERCRRDNPERGEPSLPGTYDAKICARCGRIRVRKHIE